jgi:predicted DNA-binding transcriptional regulator YafY
MWWLSRLIDILFHLQAKRVITSQQLAEKFGINQRTVYRDSKALEDAGVPVNVKSERGSNQYSVE